MRPSARTVGRAEDQPCVDRRQRPEHQKRQGPVRTARVVLDEERTRSDESAGAGERGQAERGGQTSPGSEPDGEPEEAPSDDERDARGYSSSAWAMTGAIATTVAPSSTRIVRTP